MVIYGVVPNKRRQILFFLLGHPYGILETGWDMWDSGSHFGSGNKGWSEWWNQVLKGVGFGSDAERPHFSTSRLLLCWRYLSHPLNFYPLSPEWQTQHIHSLPATTHSVGQAKGQASGATTGRPRDDRPAEEHSALTPIPSAMLHSSPRKHKSI